MVRLWRDRRGLRWLQVRERMDPRLGKDSKGRFASRFLSLCQHRHSTNSTSILTKANFLVSMKRTWADGLSLRFVPLSVSFPSHIFQTKALETINPAASLGLPYAESQPERGDGSSQGMRDLLSRPRPYSGPNYRHYPVQDVPHQVSRTQMRQRQGNMFGNRGGGLHNWDDC